MKLTLAEPVTFGSEVVRELTFRDRIVSGDLRGGVAWTKILDRDHETIMRIAGRLCAQPDAVMNALSLRDTVSVLEVVMGFFLGQDKTG